MGTLSLAAPLVFFEKSRLWGGTGFHLLPSFHYHPTQHIISQTVTLSHPNLNFLQYTIQILVPHVMWSVQTCNSAVGWHWNTHTLTFMVIRALETLGVYQKAVYFYSCGMDGWSAPGFVLGTSRIRVQCVTTTPSRSVALLLFRGII